MSAETTNACRRPRDTGRSSAAQRAALASVAVALALIIAKSFAWYGSGAVVMLGTLVDSVLDSLASLANFAAVRFAYVPPDAEHRFGHGKAEALSGLVQGAIILASTAFLIYEAGRHLIEPRSVDQGTAAIAVLLGSAALTLALVLYQRSVARRTGSLAIDADRLHYESDLLVNLGAAGAIAVASWGGPLWVDPVAALAIAAYVGWSAAQILRRALDQLMDRELSEAERHAIRSLAFAHAAVKEVHALRTRAAGPRVYIQFHITLDADIPLSGAHSVALDVERAVLARFPHADVLIHMDPEGAPPHPSPQEP